MTYSIITDTPIEFIEKIIQAMKILEKTPEHSMKEIQIAYYIMKLQVVMLRAGKININDSYNKEQGK